MPTLAVLGLGAMGLPMAQHLSKTFPVRAYDVDPDRCAAAAAFCRTEAAAADAATGCGVILVAVRNQEQLEDLLWGSNGIVRVLHKGDTIVLTSTVGVDAVRDVAARLGEPGLNLVDAPVSGGPVRAGDGTLLVTVGADDVAYESALPVLQAMSGTLRRVGARPGDGQAMKTVNQLLCGVHIAAAAEALALAAALGLDTAEALEVLAAGAAASFMLSDRGPRMLQAYDGNDAEVRSRLDIFVKDMGIVTTACREAHVAAPVTAAAQQVYLLGEAHGLAARDDSTVIKVLAPNPPKV